MAHTNDISTKPKKLTPWQIFTNNGRFNSALPPSQRNVQYRIASNVDRTGHSNTDIRSCQTTRDRSLSSIKTNNRISSSISSINNIRMNQEHNIHIDLRVPSNRYPDSQVQRTLSSFSVVDNTNNSVNQSRNSLRRRSSHLIENVPELTRECVICLLDQPINLFEERYSNECEHLQRTICDTCVYNHIKSLVENMENSNIMCPERNCISRFSFENIRYILRMGNNLELFERYDRQLTHEHLEQIQEFVWCAHNGCGSGQFHDMGLYTNPMVTCIKCKKQTCSYHRIIWHIGMTCQEYDQSKRSIDDNTQIWLNKYSKKCPKCQTYIEKISGCDHMTCKKCKHQFCWQCFADYKKIQIHGLTQHKKHCTHYPFHHRSNNNIYYRQRSTICNIL